MKTNMYMLILLLLLTQLIVGCGARRGPFVELGGGMAPVVAHEEWTARTYGDAAFSSQPLINQTLGMSSRNVGLYGEISVSALMILT